MDKNEYKLHICNNMSHLQDKYAKTETQSTQYNNHPVRQTIMSVCQIQQKTCQIQFSVNYNRKCVKYKTNLITGKYFASEASQSLGRNAQT